MSDEEEAPAGVAAAAGDAEAAAGDAAPAGSHSLLDHLFLRVTQNKDKVILGLRPNWARPTVRARSEHGLDPN